MHALLDEQVAARLKAECRDEHELHRFQRGVFILAQLLDALGFPKTAKAFQRLRYEAGEIPEVAPQAPLEPLVHPLFVRPQSVPPVPQTEPLRAEVDSRKRKRKATA